MTRASTGSWKWVEEIALQTKIQKWYIQIIDYPYMNDMNLKEHVQCWIEMWHFCFTSQSNMFQSYLWQHIDVQADWRRRWTYDRVPMSDIPKGFYWAHKGTGTGSTLFLLSLKNRTPRSNSWIHQMIELSLKKYIWMQPLLGVEFQPQVQRCATGIMLALCSEGRLFELNCPRAISRRTSDGKEVKRRIRASGPV